MSKHWKANTPTSKCLFFHYTNSTYIVYSYSTYILLSPLGLYSAIPGQLPEPGTLHEKQYLLAAQLCAPVC